MMKMTDIRVMKKLIAVVVVLVLTVTTMEGSAGTVRAAVPALSGKSYVRTYTLSAGTNTPVYADASLKRRGTVSPRKYYNAYISPSDEVYVYSMAKDVAYISYPTSSGRRYGYIRASAITSNNYSKDVRKSSGSFKTYIRPGSKAYGSVAKGDNVYTVASEKGYKQIIYPVGTLWKMAWVTDTDYNRYILGGGGTDPQGYLDAVVSNAPERLTVEGWMFDRDDLSAKLKTLIYVGRPAGSGAPGYEITANKRRADVNKAYPGVGEYHGFSQTIKVTVTGTQTVYVYAVNVGGGQNVLVGTKTVYIQDKKGGTNPQGWIDYVVSNKDRQLTFGGWAFDWDKPEEAVQIHVYIGGPAGQGTHIATLTADKQRKDVNAAYPGIGDNHGFSQSVNVNYTGKQTVYLYAINVGGGDNVLIGSKTVDIRGKSDTKVSYETYWGVNYRNAGLSAERIACLDKAVKMLTIKWENPVTFPTWKSAAGVYNRVKAADGTISTSFMKGKTYVGIPYSMADHTFDDSAWADLVNSSRFTAAYMTTNYAGRTNTTAHGTDCSYLTYLCFRASGTATRVTYQNTASMLNSSYYQKKSLSSIKGGDIALKSGHVMLYVGKTGSRYAFIEADASDSKVSYNTYTASQLSGYGIYKFKGFRD